MSDRPSSDDRWQRLARHLRPSAAAPDEAPFGFATRVVAAANLGLPPQSRALALWRRWSLGMAATAAVMLAISSWQTPAQNQFLPLPALEMPTSVTR